MGRPLISQRRGKGSPSFKAPSHHFKARSRYGDTVADRKIAQVTKFIDDPSRTAVLTQLTYADQTTTMIPAAEGLKINDLIEEGATAGHGIGHILPLSSIPEGTPIFNIELRAGDGGKLVRSSGSAAYLVSKEQNKASVKLPSGKLKYFPLNVRATLGIVAGGGRVEKPLLKAGNAHYKHKAKGQWYPTVRGVKMNPVEHPFGGTQHHGSKTKKGKGGSPGQHVGSFGASRTGRKKR
ncbi:MAG: 50S ribosomal protein L2 [DPANN group archaeon]|nr:50S ribosomal protein L2 [DPANN group archaeon]